MIFDKIPEKIITEDSSQGNDFFSAVGVLNKAKSPYSTAMGYNNTAEGTYANVFGVNNYRKRS